jgi:hypothetical protein
VVGALEIDGAGVDSDVGAAEMVGLADGSELGFS